jgi:adenosyl cobinamide kinase/adenosyl cobinamide phosphate guanylyltransferase
VITLLVGGARSGKSALAVEIGRRYGGPVTFVATCAPFDDDLAARVARHRAERPDWPTIEEPLDLAGAVGRCGAGLAIVDCLTLWVGNVMHRGDDDARIEAAAAAAAELAVRRAERSEPTVVISNEVGLGIHPESSAGRRYRDLLGRVNQLWAARAERTLLMVAGRALPLGDPWPLLVAGDDRIGEG